MPFFIYGREEGRTILPYLWDNKLTMMEIHVVPNEIGPFVRRVVFDTTMEFGF